MSLTLSEKAKAVKPSSTLAITAKAKELKASGVDVVGFGAGESLLGNEGTDVMGAGAGVEPISMVMIPKKGNTAEGVRVLDLSKGSEANKALSDLGLIITDLVKSYLGSQSDEAYDESEYIEPEFTTTDETEEE